LIFRKKPRCDITSDLGKITKSKQNYGFNNKYTIFMKKLLGVDTLYLNSQKRVEKFNESL